MKEKFIVAYMYAYGSSRKKALSVYKTASEGYIQAIIDGYNHDCKKAFYND